MVPNLLTDILVLFKIDQSELSIHKINNDPKFNLILTHINNSKIVTSFLPFCNDLLNASQ
jgi:hypothetical protein